MNDLDEIRSISTKPINFSKLICSKNCLLCNEARFYRDECGIPFKLLCVKYGDIIPIENAQKFFGCKE